MEETLSDDGMEALFGPPSPVARTSEMDELEELIKDMTDREDERFYRTAVKEAMAEATSLREKEKAAFDQETAAMKTKTLRMKLKKKPARPAHKSTTPSPRSHACSRPNQFPRLLSL